ncbi:NAD-dependent epimerase/dehydratase family protein [Labedella endophytica]|uniref:NAD(P)-dependent oxidoreductase n=1 Tax=Labedella endophytica TaxID=1523160 RepID=A0A433JWX6_9MICO|nr:NAD(P)-dependent oxidoreductase [Labedella endophytica]RUR03505.1 NAD(P)-dependent oxidoreductase [Labedella endophytica]
MLDDSALDGIDRVLVTGADGRVGRAACDALTSRGVAVTGLALDWTAESSADRLVTGDARDRVAVAEALDGVDAIVHTAAIAHPSLGDAVTVFGVNTISTLNVLSSAGERGIRRAVICSSINAFGVPMNHHDIAPAYYPLDEDMPVALDDWYSLSKLTDENTARMAASRWGMSIVALRLPFVRSGAELLEYSRRLSNDPDSFATLAKEGWSYIAVQDAVTAIIGGLADRPAGAHVLMVAADDTVIDLPTDELLRRYAPDVPVRTRITGRTGLVDSGRALRLFGWRPEFSVHAASGDHAPVEPEQRPSAAARISGTDGALTPSDT